MTDGCGEDHARHVRTIFSPSSLSLSFCLRPLVASLSCLWQRKLPGWMEAKEEMA